MRNGDVVLSRGGNALVYGGGVRVPVRTLDPASFLTVEPLIDAARAADGADRVVLVAGHVPAGWRRRLRQAGVSFASDDGVVEIFIPGTGRPGLRVCPGPDEGPDEGTGEGPGGGRGLGGEPGRQPGGPVVRRVTTAGPMSLRPPHLPVLQALVIAATRGERLTQAELAVRAGAQRVFAAEAVAELEECGYAERRRDGEGRVSVAVPDVAALAGVLGSLIAWPGSGLAGAGNARVVAGGFLWGRNRWDMAATLSRNAAAAGIALAVTGRAGAAFHGVSGPSSRIEVRCWVAADTPAFAAIAERLGLQAVPAHEANVLVAADPWGVGTGGVTTIRSGKWEASVAHPVRLWCDLRREDGGRDLASALWTKAFARDSPGLAGISGA